jgi:hypothetical protein
MNNVSSARFARGFSIPSNAVAHCASRLTRDLISGGQCAPVIRGRTCYYLSGKYEATEINFSATDGRFTVRRFEKNARTGQVVCTYQENVQDPTSFIESDVRHSRARLTDMAAIRGVGSNPDRRAMNPLIDGVGTVLAFIDANLNSFFSKATNVAQRKANNVALSDDLDDQPLRMMPTRDPKRWTFAIQNEDQLPKGAHLSLIQPVISRGWNDQGELIQRGKPVAGSRGGMSIDAPKIGKVDRKERLLAQSDRQIEMASKALASGDPCLAAHYRTLAADSTARAKLVAEEIESLNRKRREALIEASARKYRAANAALIANRTEKIAVAPPEATASLVAKAAKNLAKVREERAREATRRESRKTAKGSKQVPVQE